MKLKNTEISAEIKKISSKVAKSLPDQRNVTIPQTYFEELEETLMSQARISMASPGELKDIPEGYFENNEEKFLKNIPRSTVWMNHWKSIAAALVFVVMAVIFFDQKQTLPEQEIEMAWVYIDENLNNLEWEDLIENQFLEESDIGIYDYVDEETADSLSEEDYLE